ncbi:hypothetical protein TNCV_1266371 [Trichonephila clavipes]|nr:hypothetical protein TNCV_1266371 [Trichonephila clavipes]
MKNELKVRSGYLPFRTNASTLPITPRRSSSRDVGTSSYRYHTATEGTQFQSVDVMKAKTTGLLKMVTPYEPQNCFGRCKTRM